LTRRHWVVQRFDDRRGVVEDGPKTPLSRLLSVSAVRLIVVVPVPVGLASFPRPGLA